MDRVAEDLLIMQKYSVCRLCLCTGDLFNIFDELKIEFELKETIEDLIRCEVEREDNWAWLVCSTCFAKLIEFRLFKRRCLESKLAFDIRFRNVMVPFNIQPKEELQEPNLEETVPDDGQNGSESQPRGMKSEGGDSGASWMVPSGELYLKRPGIHMTDDADEAASSEDREGKARDDNGLTVSSIIRVSRETFDVVEMPVTTGQAENESIGVEDLTDEGPMAFKMEEQEADSGGVGESSQLGQFLYGSCVKMEEADINENELMNVEANGSQSMQMEAAFLRESSGTNCLTQAPAEAKEGKKMDVSCVKIESLLESNNETNKEVLGYEGTDPVSSKSIASQDMKQESDWNEEEPIKRLRPERYKSCFVPMCPNKGDNCRGKLFAIVPRGNRRKKWFRAANVLDSKMGCHLYCCEDHFEPEEDFLNYNQLKCKRSLAFKHYLKTKPDVVPRYFECQKNRHVDYHQELQETSRTLEHQGIQRKLLNEVSCSSRLPLPTRSSNIRKKVKEDLTMLTSAFQEEAVVGSLGAKPCIPTKKPFTSDEFSDDPDSSSSAASTQMSHVWIKEGKPAMSCPPAQSNDKGVAEKKRVKAPRKQTFDLSLRTEFVELG